MRLAWHLIDVFTERPFGGNPLAVFPDAGDLDPAWMPRIAAELNLSETAFVLPPAEPRHHRRVRIFTPRMELPFAGHPTIGTAILLADLEGRAGESDMVLEEAAGPVPVRVCRGGGRPSFARLELAGPFEIRPSAPSAALARVVGLAPDDLDAGEPARAASAGVPFTLIPVRDRAALARARLDPAAWADTLADHWAPHVYLYTRGAGTGADLRVRMFAPAMGIAEDPATGAGAAALAVALAVDGSGRWVIEQGIEMGRPSRIELEADAGPGGVERVRLGGSAARVSSGEMEIPEG